jgi:hypothetical protein
VSNILPVGTQALVDRFSEDEGFGDIAHGNGDKGC